MAKELSKEIRERIIFAYKTGRHPKDIASFSGCHRTTVDRILAAYNRDGRIKAKLRGGKRPKILTDKHKNAIKKYLAEDCTISLDKLKYKLHKKFKVQIGKSSIDRAISEFNYTLKRISLIPKRRNDKDTVKMRYAYAREFLNLLMHADGANIYFLDEVGFKVSMRSRRGRSLKGKRAVMMVPNLRTLNVSVCCVMSK
jgi:transposase